MKSKVLIIFLVSLSLFLSGCDFDEMFESNQQHDGDDMNVIKNIWPQALDQMLWSEKSTSIAQWLDQPVQQASVDAVPLILPQPTDIQPSPAQPSTAQITTIQASSSPANSQTTHESEDRYEWEDD